MSDSVKLTQENGIAYVQLNRALKRNAVNRDMFHALGEIGGRLADDPSLRTVILSGAGEHFCAGIDVSAFAGDGIDASLMAPLPGTPANLLQNAAYVWRQMPVPVIAALSGVVFGAGLQIALGADVRIADASVRMSVMEIKWGLIPDMALSTTLPALLPYDKAAELTWTGRVIESDEARDIGLVSALVENPLAGAEQLAREIASQSPDAVRAAKQVLRSSYADRDAGLLRLEAELQMQVLAGTNQKEAVSANLEKREARFGDSSL